MSPKQRSDSDRERDLQVYKYLLQLCGFEDRQIPNKDELVKMWGYRGNDKGNKFVGRLIDYLQIQKIDSKSVPELSLNQLVEILEGMDNYFKHFNNQQQNFQDSNKSPKLIQNSDKIRAIRKYCELTRDEKTKLKLPTDFKSYIQENFINEGKETQINDIQTNNLAKEILSLSSKKDTDIKKESQSTLEKFIKEFVNKSIGSETAEVSEEWMERNKNYVKLILDNVIDQFNSIIVQSGLENISKIEEILHSGCQEVFNQSFSDLLTGILCDQSIMQLTKNIIDNIKLFEKFSIELKNIEIDKAGSFPLDNRDLINENLVEFDENPESIKRVISIFRKKHTYRVKINFCLNLKLENKKVDFTEEIRGTSSILSLTRKALNRAIFWDIPSLKDYFPIAQEVYIEDKLFGGDSLATVCSKSRIRLVKLADLKILLQENELKKIVDLKILLQENQLQQEEIKELEKQEKSCPLVNFNSYVEGSDIFQGEFFGFDLIESIAQSGFYARLKILNEININSSKYLQELENRIEEKKQLIKGRQYLRSYPFSLLAMEHHFKQNILAKYTYKDGNFKQDVECTNIAYQAILYIIQGYLTEGLY